ncbi:MAG: hypothetical protein ACRDQ7_25210 [Haloechinothrix sp.]
MQSSGPEDNTEGGLSRRALFRVGGGGVAVAAIIGLGVGPGIASVAAAAPAGRTPPEKLKSVEPHAFTERTVGADVRGMSSSRVRIRSWWVTRSGRVRSRAAWK